jgi:hypothetical protein
MDASEPPRIVFDSGAACPDREGAEEALRRALERARAPRPGWVVTARIEATTASELTAEVDIVDDGGANFAHRLSSGQDCGELARSAGDWASRALEAEVKREEPAPLPEIPKATPAPVVPGVIHPVPPGPMVASFPALRLDEPVEADEQPKLELGVGTFLLAGGGPGGDVGVTPFLIGRVGEDTFLRPSLALGKPASGSGGSTWGAARLDICQRLSGLYSPGQGMDLDLCGGADVGFSFIASGVEAGSPPASITQPYVDLGPSVDLRAEVGRMLISLRGVAGFNVARQGFDDVNGVRVDPAIWSLRVELDLSWKLHDAPARWSTAGAVIPR